MADYVSLWLTPRSVVRRQMHLMKTMSKAKAYDQARKEFYRQRLQEDVERRVAKEEAMATGAYFGKTMMQIGTEMEDRAYERWKTWAQANTVELAQKRAGAST